MWESNKTVLGSPPGLSVKVGGVRGGQKWISAHPYPAGFEMSGWVAKGWPGLPKRYCAGFCPPVSARRALENPAGISLPAGSTRNPAGWSGTRLPVAPVKS